MLAGLGHPGASPRPPAWRTCRYRAAAGLPVREFVGVAAGLEGGGVGGPADREARRLPAYRAPGRRPLARPCDGNTPGVSDRGTRQPLAPV